MKLKKKVLITQFIHPDGMKILEDAVEEVVLAPDPKPETLLSMMDDSIDGIIVRHNRLTAEMIEKCTNLQVIARHGIGTELIDLDAATRQGVIVTNTPHAATVSVAEHTMMYILMLGRKIMTADKEQRKANFAIKVTYKPDDVEGKTVGIIGLGHIGSIVAKYCNAFDMNVIAYDPRLTEEDGLKYGAKMMPDMNSVLREADFVTIHTPQSEETIHMISTEEFALMKPTAYFINCARGPIVDEKALIEALENQIHAGNAHKIRARVIVEGANGPTSIEADEILKERGIVLVPDILANAGGVIVSYFEWVQNIQSVSWSEEHVNDQLKEIMDQSFKAVWDISKEKETPLRIGAYLIAVKRVVEAKNLRGIWP